MTAPVFQVLWILDPRNKSGICCPKWQLLYQSQNPGLQGLAIQNQVSTEGDMLFFLRGRDSKARAQQRSLCTCRVTTTPTWYGDNLIQTPRTPSVLPCSKYIPRVKHLAVMEGEKEGETCRTVLPPAGCGARDTIICYTTHREWKELGLKLGLTPANHPHGPQQRTHGSCRTCDTRKALPPKHKAQHILPSPGFLWPVVSSKVSCTMERSFCIHGCRFPSNLHGLHGISFPSDLPNY